MYKTKNSKKAIPPKIIVLARTSNGALTTKKKDERQKTYNSAGSFDIKYAYIKKNIVKNIGPKKPK